MKTNEQKVIDFIVEEFDAIRENVECCSFTEHGTEIVEVQEPFGGDSHYYKIKGDEVFWFGEHKNGQP